MCAEASTTTPPAPVGGAPAPSLPRPPDPRRCLSGGVVGPVNVVFDHGVYHPPAPPVRVVELSTPLLVECLSDDEDDDDNNMNYSDFQKSNSKLYAYGGAVAAAAAAPPSPVPSMGSDGSVSWFDMDELMRSTEYAGLKGHHGRPSEPVAHAGTCPTGSPIVHSPSPNFSLARSLSSSSSQWSS